MKSSIRYLFKIPNFYADYTLIYPLTFHWRYAILGFRNVTCVLSLNFIAGRDFKLACTDHQWTIHRRDSLIFDAGTFMWTNNFRFFVIQLLASLMSIIRIANNDFLTFIFAFLPLISKSPLAKSIMFRFMIGELLIEQFSTTTSADIVLEPYRAKMYFLPLVF